MNKSFLQLVERFVRADTRQRDEIRNGLTEKEQLGLLQFMKDAAIEAVRQNSKEILVCGIYANVLENVRNDFRDNLVHLTLLYHSTLIIELDPEMLFIEIAEDSKGEGSDLLRTYIRRSPENKTLECMCYEETWEPEFNFVSIRWSKDKQCE